MKLKINLKQHMQNYNQHLNCLCEWTWSILSQCSPVICSCLKPNKKKIVPAQRARRATVKTLFGIMGH